MKKVILLLIVNFLLANELIFYCGITMRKPMAEIARIFEKKHYVKIHIIPGGSKALLKTIKTAKKGDLYLPGSEGYVLKNKNLFLDYKEVGYNQLGLVVKKGNPKHIKGLDDLLRTDIKVVLCNYKLSSCGKETKKVLTKYKGEEFFYTVLDRCVEVVLDSRPLNDRVKTVADVGPNWKATAKWKGNKEYLDVIDIPAAKKHRLLLAVVKYSKNKKLAEEFLKFATSPKGLEIMKKYGFRDENE